MSAPDIDKDSTGAVPIGLIGCGEFGEYMAEVISGMPEFRIEAVCDSSERRGRDVGEKLGVPSYTDFLECLERSPVAAVALFTPNHLHHGQAIAAAGRAKHIFCEKPMALKLEHCYEMLAAAGKANVRLMVGHKRRLRPQYLKIAEIVRARTFGRVITVNINGYFGRPAQGWWRSESTSGGLLAYAGVHDIDFLRCICGEVASISARVPIKTNPQTDYEDAISVLLQFESGVVGTLEVSPLYPLQTFREAFIVQIVFEHGGLCYEPHSFTVRVHGNGGEKEEYSFDNESGFVQAYTTELRSFARWIQLGETPPLTGWDGLRCVEIMEAAKISAYRGVEVPLPLPKTGSPPCNSVRPFRYANGFAMPEGPAFDRDGNLYVANCRADYVSRITPDGRSTLFVRTGGKTQGVAIHPDGRLFITDWLRRKIFVATASGELSTYCESYSDGSPLRGPNEISFGPNGQIYFTDPGDAWRGLACGVVSRVTATGAAEILAEGFEFTNGLDFDPEDRMLYFADTTRPRILRAPLNRDGSLQSAPTEFFAFPDTLRPDGIRFAANGNLYVTLFGAGKIVIIHADGSCEDSLTLPGLFPTNLAFYNGSMFVCEGQTGSVWAFHNGVKGCPTYAQKLWRNA